MLISLQNTATKRELKRYICTRLASDIIPT